MVNVSVNVTKVNPQTLWLAWIQNGIYLYQWLIFNGCYINCIAKKRRITFKLKSIKILLKSDFDL